MKRFIIYLVMISVFASVVSCSRTEIEKLPRDVYASSSDGAALKKSPDDGAERAGTLPFGWKITVTEKAPIKKDSGTNAWYKTSWNGAEVWISSASFSGSDVYAGSIQKRVDEGKSSIKNEFQQLFSAVKTDGMKRYTYTGGEMEPACITLLQGGGMILNSKIFSEDYKNFYFAYEFLNGDKLLKIKFIDSRLNFNDYADIENSSSSVFKIDRNDSSITYHVRNGSFFFMNWGFNAEN